ncbi:MAG: dTDP-glucose 4,6-dehydratase [Saprospiraceae bacterium]
MQHNILITGGAGFIGSHLVRHMLKTYPQYKIINLDLLTYAGNLENLKEIDGLPNYTFIKGDICDADLLDDIMTEYQINGIIHTAAESHVDRSISDPISFVKTNVLGTATLLNAAKKAWSGNYEGKLFFHISTDEVYGSLGSTGYFTETTAYDPRSPYSSTKAGSDHLVMAYHHTYRMPVLISNCSNNYGPYQFPEKLIPLCIANILANKPLPIYGEGLNVRDWLFVEDHVSAIDLLFHKGKPGQTYNIGGHNEWTNIDLVRLLCKIMDKKLDQPVGTSEALILYVQDRAGHDARYAIDASKIAEEFGWKPSLNFEQGLEATAEWYINNPAWLEHVITGAYRDYYQGQYHERANK